MNDIETETEFFIACPKCCHTFKISYSLESTLNLLLSPKNEINCICPNCDRSIIFDLSVEIKIDAINER